MTSTLAIRESESISRMTSSFVIYLAKTQMGETHVGFWFSWPSYYQRGPIRTEGLFRLDASSSNRRRLYCLNSLDATRPVWMLRLTNTCCKTSALCFAQSNWRWRVQKLHFDEFNSNQVEVVAKRKAPPFNYQNSVYHKGTLPELDTPLMRLTYKSLIRKLACFH